MKPIITIVGNLMRVHLTKHQVGAAGGAERIVILAAKLTGAS